MKFLALILALALAAIAAFAALNWNALFLPSELSLGFATVQMPLGLVMLGMLALLAGLFLVFAVYMQGSALMEMRRHARELQANRELADRAEASRFTELHTYLETQLGQQSRLAADQQTAILARVDRLEDDMHAYMEQSGNTLAAYIGELEDRLENGRMDSGPKSH